MAKFTSNLLHTCRIQLRLVMLRRQFSCKLCQKSYPSICFSSIVRLRESRRLSTNRLVFQQKNANFLSISGNTESDVGNLSNKNVSHVTEQEQLLHSVIEKGDSLSLTDWDVLKFKIFGLPGYINSFNFDAVAMGFCIASKQYKIGLSLFDHIASLGKEANVATLSRFLKLCYVCHSAPAPKDVQAVVESVYSKLSSLCSLMDGSTAENAVHGLVLTDKWKEGIELLTMIKLTGVPSSSTYNVLAKAAFDYNDVDAGWELMNEMVLNGRRPTPSTYSALLNFCARCPNKDDGHETVKKLLSFFSDNDLRPTKDVAENLQSWFKKENPNWKSSMTTLNNKGLCKSCKSNLEPITITKEEFGALRSCFIDKVVVGSNVFLKTTPEELKAFQKFLERSVPYDVVIDGLNVAYSAKSNKGVPHSAYLLQTVVKHFLDKSQKVLLFGRKHMQSWPKRPMNFIFSNTKTFLADNIPLHLTE
ncbi:mitochondrial ribonuclease P catalytic subunit isoform X2 [Anabrus simplex]|uniref:mitochondrial ribonuclease P catalytic subunit isoform X2 n=1 Tax=Anabrus simplex TaxID=316456 RepID=UPI0035A39EA7